MFFNSVEEYGAMARRRKDGLGVSPKEIGITDMAGKQVFTNFAT